MVLNEESVNAYRTIAENPAEYKLTCPALKDCFESTEIATAKHILFDQYLELTKLDFPKLIFYIIMKDIYPVGKSPDGSLGYMVKIKN